MDIENYWQACLKQQAKNMKKYFHEDAYVNWPNTNEHFTVDEFIRVNCEYPGKWDGQIEFIVEKDGLVVTAVHVFSRNRKQSFHVTSFIEIKDDKIVSINEYWGDDGTAPQWRIDMHIGIPIITSDK